MGKPMSRDADILLETEHLVLRRMRHDDLNDIARINADPNVMRYIADGSLRSREVTAANIRRTHRIYEIYPGLGFWVGEEKPKRKFIGVFALVYIPKTVQVEVGYRLRKSAWGRGLATEGARALVRYGMVELGLERIAGLTHPDNIASQSVLMKAGLRRHGMGHYYERDLCYFVAERTNLLSNPKAV